MDKAYLVGDNLRQCENDYKSGGIFYDLFLAPKIRFCLRIDKYGDIQEHNYTTFLKVSMTVNGF